jgi:hypothetical protein
MKFSTIYKYRSYRYLPEITFISFFDTEGERVANWYVDIDDIQKGLWYFRCLFNTIPCEDMPIKILYDWEQLVTEQLKQCQAQDGV